MTVKIPKTQLKQTTKILRFNLFKKVNAEKKNISPLKNTPSDKEATFFLAKKPCTVTLDVAKKHKIKITINFIQPPNK